MKAKLSFYCYEDGGRGSATVVGSSMNKIRSAAEQSARSWLEEDGEWGPNGAIVTGKWAITAIEDINDDNLSGFLSNDVEVEIEPQHDVLIADAVGRAKICGLDPEDHDWTVEGEGGLKENPGVQSLGGTKISFKSHCRTCGLHRTKIDTGSQRNPGEHNTVKYRMLDKEEIEQHRSNGTMD